MEKELPTIETSTDEVITESEDRQDPLDTLTDVEEIRREAKKYRGIAARKEKKEVPAQTADTPYLTRDEFYATNRKQAITLISQISDNDPLAETKRDLNDNWDDIVKYYVVRNGQETPENILEDIYDAHLVWKRRQPGGADDSARILQGTVVTTPTGGRTETKTDTKSDSRFSKGTPPAKWYAKKE